MFSLFIYKLSVECSRRRVPKAERRIPGLLEHGPQPPGQPTGYGLCITVSFQLFYYVLAKQLSFFFRWGSYTEGQSTQKLRGHSAGAKTRARKEYFKLLLGSGNSDPVE